MKKLYVVLFLVTIYFCNACAAPKNTPLVTRAEILSPIQTTIINYGLSYLNTPYRYGAKGPSFFDCSGFTSYIFEKVGYNLPGNSRRQAAEYPEVSKNELAIGDLVFFEGRRRNGRVGHVGIVTEVKEDGSFDFVHAAVKKGVTVSSSTEDYYAARYLRAGRVLKNEHLTEVVTENAQGNTITATTNEGTLSKTIYVVKKGDTLSKIARRNNCTVAQLREWNTGLKTLIHIGDELLIYIEP